MKNILNIINDQDREFNVKIIVKGDAYGRENCLTHAEDRPLVEFYDATYSAANGDDRFDDEGQFVSRYYLHTLLERQRGYGLDLMGYEPNWKIDARTMQIVIDWLENQNKRLA